MSITDHTPQSPCSCSPVPTRQSIGADTADTMAVSFKALADPTRLRLVSMVAAHAEGESCVCDLTEMLGLSQPTVSHHLKVLVESGILHRAKRGTWSYYSLVPESLDSIAALLSKIESLSATP